MQFNVMLDSKVFRSMSESMMIWFLSTLIFLIAFCFIGKLRNDFKMWWGSTFQMSWTFLIYQIKNILKPLLREMVLNKDKISRPNSALMELYNQGSRRPSMATRRCSEVILTNDSMKKFRHSERRKSQLSPTYKNVNFLTTEINEN